MNYGIEEILELQKCSSTEGVPPDMVYRKEKNNKIINEFIMAILLIVASIAVMTYIVILLITTHLLTYLIAFVFPLIAFIILTIHLKYFLYQLFNQDYKIVVKDNKLHFYHSSFEVVSNLPIPIMFEGKDIILGTLNNIYEVKLYGDTVNDSGKELLDFLMEVNGLSISTQKEAP